MGCQVMVEIKVPFPMQKHGVQHNRGTRRIPVGFVTILKKKGTRRIPVGFVTILNKNIRAEN
jgi:hypothetical protein